MLILVRCTDNILLHHSDYIRQHDEIVNSAGDIVIDGGHRGRRV